MPEETSFPPLLDPVTLGFWLAKRRHIWQMGFLSPKELADFAEKRGLSWYREEHINLLWKLGLLKADLIVSSQEIDEEGLILVGQEQQDEEENGYQYADARLPELIQDSADISLEEIQAIPSTLKIYFHPFRFYVLQHFERLVPHFEPPRILYPQTYRVSESMAIWLQMTTLTQEYLQSTQHWNDIAALLVATEPCFYERIFQRIRVSRLADPNPGESADTIIDASFEALYAEIDEHWNDLSEIYRQIGVERLDQLHQELCVFTQILDKNRDVHTLLRLANDTTRLNLEGRLGGAMLLRAMAEMLRRATERALGIQLREEDERGFGYVPEDIKQRKYGDSRLLDGNRNADNEFLRQHGLCYGPRLRWYVEGQTEFGGLDSFFKRIGATDIEILNLQGQIVQRNGVAFRESLRSDIRMGIFSFVSLDEDVLTNVQAVRAAAQQDQICGKFFLSSPDFEFGNFDLAELQEIVWDIALEQGVPAEKKPLLFDATATSSTGKMFVKAVERLARDAPEFWGVSKGRAWGERLVRYALRHPSKPNGEDRPVVAAIRQALTVRTSNYNYTRVHRRVDPQTGNFIERIPPLTAEERQQEI